MASWSTNFARGRGLYSTCNGYYIMGGYDVMQANEYVSRTFTNVPSHDIVVVTFQAWMIDSLDSNEGFSIRVDSSEYYFTVSNYNSAPSQICGSPSFTDGGGVFVTIKLFHNISSITVRGYNRANQDPQDESIGFRDLTITFRYKFPGETEQIYLQGSFIPPNLPSGTIASTCSSGQYYTGSACATCFTLCSTCTWGLAGNCTSCKSGYYLHSNSTCQVCSPLCKTCLNEGSSSCTSCVAGYYLFVDGSCRPNCGGTADTSGVAWTCTCSNYIYPNGTCFNTLGNGYNFTTISGSKFTAFKCASGIYYFQNNTCVNWCPTTFLPYNVYDGLLCNFPCVTGQYYFQNNTCMPNCPSPFWVYDVNVGKYCNWVCETFTQFYYQNGSCLQTCPQPLVNYTYGVEKYCYHPCTSPSIHIYDNYSCINDCPWPFVSLNISIGMYCKFPCDYPYLIWLYSNGSCLPCGDPFLYRVNSNLEFYCEFPCKNGYLYNDKSCYFTCNYPYRFRNSTVGKYCDFICADDQYLFSNGSCLNTCPFPYQNRTSFNKLETYCEFPCSNTSFYYPNGTCLSKCEWPYIKRDVTVGFYCEFPCTGGKFYYINGSCMDSCPSTGEYITYATSDGSYCIPNCTYPQYGLRNYTCITNCTSPYAVSNTQIGKFCDFDCPTNYFFYSNQSCQSSCNNSFTARYVGSERYCDFKCGNEYILANYSCTSTCSLPFIPRVSYTYKYCDYTCRNSEYFYSNNTCQKTCPKPFISKNFSVATFCYFPCPNIGTWYFTHNSSCGFNCTSPYIPGYTNVGNYCYPAPPGETEVFELVQLGSMGVAAASGALILAEPGLFWGVVSTYQDVYFMNFFNVKYQNDTSTFLKSFNFGAYSIIPSIFDVFGVQNSIKSSYTDKAPEKFKSNGYSSLYLDTASRIFTIWAVAFLLYLVLSILNYITERRHSLLVSVLEVGRSTGALQLWLGTCQPLLIATWLQIIYLDFGSGVYIISSLLAILTAAITVGSIIFMIGKFFEVNKILAPEDRREAAKKWPAIFDGLHPIKKGALIFHILELSRRCLYTLAIVSLYNYSLIQIIASIALSVPTVFFLLLKKPFTHKFRNYITLLKEVALLGAHIIVFVTSRTSTSSASLGWVMVASCLIGILSVQIYSLALIIEAISRKCGFKVSRAPERVFHSVTPFKGSKIDLKHRSPPDTVRVMDVSGANTTTRLDLHSTTRIDLNLTRVDLNNTKGDVNHTRYDPDSTMKNLNQSESFVRTNTFSY